MKMYNFSIPILLALFVNYATPTTPISSEEVIEPSMEVLDATEVLEFVRTERGTMTAEQDFNNCNTCGTCEPECIESSDACIGAHIEITSIDCPFYSPQGTITLPGNSQYICSLQQTGPYSWYLEFNAGAYACGQPGIPFTFDIPIWYNFTCPSYGNGIIFATLNLIIC
ncbi:MAG: hypothetical protein AAGA77_22020 [Bacteroidota bacterium]